MENEAPPGVGTPFTDLSTRLKAAPRTAALVDSLTPAAPGLHAPAGDVPGQAPERPGRHMASPGARPAVNTIHIERSSATRLLRPLLIGAGLALVLVAGFILWRGDERVEVSVAESAVPEPPEGQPAARPTTEPLELSKQDREQPATKVAGEPEVRRTAPANTKRAPVKPSRANRLLVKPARLKRAPVKPVRPPRHVTLVVTTLCDGEMVWANVVVDGKKVGQTPLERKYAPGQHLVRVHRKGYRPVTRKVDLKPGRREGLVLELKAESK